MNDDETKKLILARRAKFVAAAVASVGLACSNKSGADAQNPINVVPADDAATPIQVDAVDAGSSKLDLDAGAPTDRDATTEPTVPPQPCLSPLPNPPDAGAPRPCLTPAKPPPRPCLSVAPKPTK